MAKDSIGFGDNVRVRVTEETQAAGVAGLAGVVFGETTPSLTGVEVIGRLTDDYAINVDFEGRDESLWFAPDLLEWIDHNPGAEITIKGVDMKWVRTESGEWEEKPGNTRFKSFWDRLTGRVFRKRC